MSKVMLVVSLFLLPGIATAQDSMETADLVSEMARLEGDSVQVIKQHLVQTCNFKSSNSLYDQHYDLNLDWGVQRIKKSASLRIALLDAQASIRMTSRKEGKPTKCVTSDWTLSMIKPDSPLISTYLFDTQGKIKMTRDALNEDIYIKQMLETALGRDPERKGIGKAIAIALDHLPFLGATQPKTKVLPLHLGGAGLYDDFADLNIQLDEKGQAISASFTSGMNVREGKRPSDRWMHFAFKEAKPVKEISHTTSNDTKGKWMSTRTKLCLEWLGELDKMGKTDIHQTFDCTWKWSRAATAKEATIFALAKSKEDIELVTWLRGMSSFGFDSARYKQTSMLMFKDREIVSNDITNLNHLIGLSPDTTSDLAISMHSCTGARLIFDSLQDAKRPITLEIGDVDFDQTTLDSLGKMASLKKLFIKTRNFPGDPNLSSWTGMKCIKEITLSPTPPSAARTLGKIDSLESMYIGGKELSGNLGHLDLPNLIALKVNTPCFIADDFESILRLKKLTSLDLYITTPLDDSALIAFIQKSAITRLSVGPHGISKAVWDAIDALPRKLEVFEPLSDWRKPVPHPEPDSKK